MRKAIWIAGVALVLLALAPGLATAVHGNELCLACHGAEPPVGPAASFATVSVDYSACWNCHYVNGVITGQDDHMHTDQTCEVCHGWSFPDGAPFASSTYLTPFGYFDNETSLLSSPAELHLAHDGDNWVDGFAFLKPTGCSACHAPVRCDVCHDGVLPHGNHGVTEYEPVAWRSTGGPDDGPAVVQTACINASCHNLAAAASDAFVPSCESCHSTVTETHSAPHDTSGVVNRGCSNCHLNNLIDEHSIHGIGCVECHMDDAYAVAISAQEVSCGACHVVPVHRSRDR